RLSWRGHPCSPARAFKQLPAYRPLTCGAAGKPCQTDLASRVIFELIVGELKADQRFKGRAQHGLAHVGARERIDRGRLVTRLALVVDLAADILGQRRGSARDTGMAGCGGRGTALTFSKPHG